MPIRASASRWCRLAVDQSVTTGPRGRSEAEEKRIGDTAARMALEHVAQRQVSQGELRYPFPRGAFPTTCGEDRRSA
jgi:hypothetical protein